MLRYISGANAPGNSDGVIAEDGGINVRALPEDIQEVFADIDANGDGVLDMDEFKTMLSTYAVLRKSNQEGSVSISTLPDKVQPALKIFDQDGDGTVDPKELMRAAELYQASKKSQKRMRKFIIGMVLFIIALIGINSAMTFMMVELGKETKASPDGVMRVNAGGGHKGAVVRTAANGEPAPLTSGLPDAAFAQLKQFQVDSPTGAHVSLVVQGWYRVPSPIATTGSIVKIMTAAGFIILDGTDMTFEETVGSVFSEAGFDVIGRKLLGIYEIVGIFNSIEDWGGLGDEEKKPGFGKHDFYMEYSTLNKCVMAFGKANSCMDMYNNTHGAYVEIDGEHYIKIDSTIIMDVDSGIAMETHFYAEFNATIEEMKSPTRRVKAQTAIYDTAVGGGGEGEDDDEDAPMYYCKELSPGDGSSSVWNVTNAEKVGETESDDGRTVREFVITTPLTSLQHDFITGFDESVPYTGLIDIKYWDDKATGYPVKFNFGGKDFVVTSYVEDDIELPEPDEWNVPEECFDMSPSDYLTDMNLPTFVPANPFRFDNRRRLRDTCELEGGCYSSEDPANLMPEFCTDAACYNSSDGIVLESPKAVNGSYVDSPAGRKLLASGIYLGDGDKIQIYSDYHKKHVAMGNDMYLGKGAADGKSFGSHLPWVDHTLRVVDGGGGEIGIHNSYRNKFVKFNGFAPSRLKSSNPKNYNQLPSGWYREKMRAIPAGKCKKIGYWSWKWNGSRSWKTKYNPKCAYDEDYVAFYNDYTGSFMMAHEDGYMTSIQGQIEDLDKSLKADYRVRFRVKFVSRGTISKSGGCSGKEEQCRKGCGNGFCWGAASTKSFTFPPEQWEPPVTFNIDFWTRGCGVKGLSLSGDCGPIPGMSCEVGGSFEGPDVCCADGTFCGPAGGVYGMISQDLLELIKGKPNSMGDKIKKKLQELGVEGSVSLILSYYKPAGRDGAITLAIVGEVSATFKKRRQLLSIDASDGDAEGQLALGSDHHHDASGRKIVWFKKTLKRAKKFVKKVAKTAAQAFKESFGFTNGVMLSLSGYAEYDLGTNNIGFGAAIEGQACLLSMCGDFTQDWST